MKNMMKLNLLFTCLFFGVLCFPLDGRAADKATYQNETKNLSNGQKQVTTIPVKQTTQQPANHSASDSGNTPAFPTRLTTNLLEHTDRVFLDGYPSNIVLENLKPVIERYQIAFIRSDKPYFGWEVNSRQPNTVQTDYRILVATSPQLPAKNEADMWDSGKTASGNSAAVLYSGKPLQPSTVYYWKVKTWDNHGTESDFSQVKSFKTAAKLDGATESYPLQASDEYPEKINQLGDGHFLIDFGKDSFGRLRLTLTSANETDTVTVHLGERLTNGHVDRKPGATIRYAAYQLKLLKGTHTYSLKITPDGRNTGRDAIKMPDYTGEVLPFRYCEIENGNAGLNPQQVVRQTVHYPFDETASTFHSSDAILNQVWEMCKYSVKATSFCGTYVDGDRERIPYEGDAIINQLCHYCVDREYAIARHSHEYLVKRPTWPTEWILQSVPMAWTDYLYTGNPESLQKFYDDLKAKTLIGLKESNGLISTRTGKMTKEFLQTIHHGGIRDIVDWPQNGIVGTEKEKAGEADGFVFTNYNTVVNACYYQSLRQMSEIAGALGKTQEQTQFADEARQVKEAINQRLFDPQKGIYRDGIDTEHSSLHANMYPLAFDLVPDQHKQKTLEFIHSRRLACSVYGSQALLDGIYNAHDSAYGLKLLSSTDERSWYNMIRAGSTISMEAWDNKYKTNQDWNHIWGAAAGNLIVRKLMGVEPATPGFGKIRIKPQPASLRQATLKTPSIRGDIYVAFDNVPNEKFTLNVTIPANTVAEVWLPKLSQNYRLAVDNIQQTGVPNGNFVTIEIGSGNHVFVIEK